MLGQCSLRHRFPICSSGGSSNRKSSFWRLVGICVFPCRTGTSRSWSPSEVCTPITSRCGVGSSGMPQNGTTFALEAQTDQRQLASGRNLHGSGASSVLKAMKKLKISPTQELMEAICTDAQVSYPNAGPTGWTYNDSFMAAANGPIYDAQPKATKEAQTARASEGSAGNPPDTDTLWGVSLYVHDAIKSVLNDPDSYRYIGVSGPLQTVYNGTEEPAG
jgi:hypothetical protein